MLVVYFTRPVCSLGSVLCCDIVEAHACWTRQFWFWYLIFWVQRVRSGCILLLCPQQHICV